MSTRCLGIGLALVLAVIPPAVSVAAPSGAVLAASCFSCHGPGGESPGAIPPLAGLDAERLRQSLDDFRAGSAEATVMTRIAKGFTPAELATIIEYLTSGN